MRHIRLLPHQILNLPHTPLIQQRVLGPQRQTQRLPHRIEVRRYSHQTRMTSDRRIHPTNTTPLARLFLPMSLQDGIPPAPAEAQRADLVRARDHAHGVDEAVDEGSRHAFAVRGQPGAEGGGDDGGVFGLVAHAEGLLRFEGGFDVLEEGDGEAVAVVEVGEVAVEAGFGVFVGEEAGVCEFPAEDWG